MIKSAENYRKGIVDRVFKI